MENGLIHENKQITGNNVEELRNGSIQNDTPAVTLNGVTNFDPPPAKKNKLTPKKVVTIVSVAKRAQFHEYGTTRHDTTSYARNEAFSARI